MQILTGKNAEVDELFHTLATALVKGQEQPRNYNGKQSLSLPMTARFKMKIWYRDGNSRTYFSYDRVVSANKSHTDEWEGLKKLIRLGHVHHAQEVRTLVIWATGEQTPLTTSATYDYEIFKVTYKGEQRREGIGFRTHQDSTVYKWDLLKDKSKKLG